MIYFGFALLALGLIWGMFGNDRSFRLANNRAHGAAIMALGVLFVALGMAKKQTARVDELWKEYATHVKFCACMTREFDIDRDGSQEAESK